MLELDTQDLMYRPGPKVSQRQGQRARQQQGQQRFPPSSRLSGTPTAASPLQGPKIFGRYMFGGL